MKERNWNLMWKNGGLNWEKVFRKDGWYVSIYEYVFKVHLRAMRNQ